MEFSDALKKWLDVSGSEKEFAVPDGYFESNESELMLKVMLENSSDDLKSPQGYFQDASNRILAAVESESSDNQEFFQKQEDTILSRIRLESIKRDNEFVVPENYFEKQEAQIVDQVNRSGSGRVVLFNVKFWGYVAAAAVVVLGLFIMWPEQRYKHDAQFATLINQTELDIDDLEYFAEDEDVYDLYLTEIEEVQDTLVQDSLSIKEPEKPAQYVTDEKGKVKLDPKTGLPMKVGTGNKANSTVLNWDDITEEDMMEYLMEEGDEDLLDE